jgi:hypothetical protein
MHIDKTFRGFISRFQREVNERPQVKRPGSQVFPNHIALMGESKNSYTISKDLTL